MSWGSFLVRKETRGKSIYKNLGWIFRRGGGYQIPSSH